ncbi:hypothetical protein FB192DRAFT_1347697 [Mucor lusitanicus]|uniref:Uncharacterized protein n=2 Tax=Mucor circinelloides f. lusitanicus TaxID=29924 RepID=A0A162YU56_MUCCL|nr:hypothetical protein FB192DRAFT_1347697 [Mucor lusitanicus]OAD00667.1 hypothetical protein MUCCIDRAFT_164602 [Mucor lusitanicus CBS 277.49]
MDHKRTFFLPICRHFGVMTGCISGECFWDFSQLDDGILANQAETMAVIIKSSGGSKWKFVKARSCIVPATITEKKACIKVFELLACLEEVVQSSLETIGQLEDESLGCITLSPDEILVKDYLM